MQNNQPVYVEIDERFLHSSYRFRKRIWSLWGNRVDIFGASGTPVLHSYQKAFRLREDIRLYGDANHSEELVLIQARQIIDFSAAYDVWDIKPGELVGTLQRRGWSSLARDKWEILDAQQNLVAGVDEDSVGLAVLRRAALGILLPATWHIRARNGQEVATVRTQFNVFYTVLLLDTFSSSFAAMPVDPRLVLAACTLLTLLEGKQQAC